MKFYEINKENPVYLYLGDLPGQRIISTGKKFIGISLFQDNATHIKHDVTIPFDLDDNMVDIVQSEDVMEHIEYSKLTSSINEVYRILKPGGLFRLSLPSYECDVLYDRSLKDENGNIIFDSGGGGSYDCVNKKVVGGGHVWFPTYVSVKQLLLTTRFNEDHMNFLHYYDHENKPVIKNIEYSLGFIARTPDNDKRVQNPRRPMSIVVDCFKPSKV
jgi:SAM-dependent methyltransferase